MAGQDPRRRKLLAILEREGYASYMNDTKWQRLIDDLRSLDLPLRYRIKLLVDSDASEWDTAFSDVPSGYVELITLGPVLALEIEWLDIDATGPWLRRGDEVPMSSADYSVEVTTLLDALRVPYSRHDTLFRVTGHQKTGTSLS